MNSLEKRIKKKGGTGKAFEESLIPSLQCGGYQIFRQRYIGQDFKGGFYVDLVATNIGEGFPDSFLISAKWQQVNGTAEEKIPFEVMRLKNAVDSAGLYQHAYLVLGGPDVWNLRDFYIGEEFDRLFPHRSAVTILDAQDFMARANRGDL